MILIKLMMIIIQNPLQFVHSFQLITKLALPLIIIIIALIPFLFHSVIYWRSISLYVTQIRHGATTCTDTITRWMTIEDCKLLYSFTASSFPPNESTPHHYMPSLQSPSHPITCIAPTVVCVYHYLLVNKLCLHSSTSQVDIVICSAVHNEEEERQQEREQNSLMMMMTMDGRICRHTLPRHHNNLCVDLYLTECVHV